MTYQDISKTSLKLSLYSFLQSLLHDNNASAQAKFSKNCKWQKHGPDHPKNALFETQTSKCRPR